MIEENVFDNNTLLGRTEENLLTETDVANRLAVTKRCLQAWRYRGGGPRFVKFSARCIRYRPDDIAEFVEGRIRASTSDMGAAATSYPPLPM